jgi:hypothetical protein
MPAALRPLSAGELLDLSFGLFRRLFRTLVVIQLICMTLPFLLNVYSSSATPGQVSPVALLNVLVSFVLSALASAATAVAISESYLERPVTAIEALRRARPRLGPLLVVSLSVGLLVLLASIPFLVLFAGAAYTMELRGGGPSGLVIFSMLLGVASLVLPLIVASGVAVATPVVVLEDGVRATEAVSRAWFLTRGYRLRIAGLLFVCLILIMIPYMALIGLGAALARGDTAPVWFAVIALLGRLLLTPILYCLLTLLYYDLRVRKEGFDLEMLAASLQPA